MHSQKRQQSQPGHPSKVGHKDSQLVSSTQPMQASELPLQLVKQFNKGVLKKSDLLLLQRFETTLQRAKPAQSVIIYDGPGAKEVHDSNKMQLGFASQGSHGSSSLQVQASLKHGKTKSVGVLNPAHIATSGSQPSLNIYVNNNAVNAGQMVGKESGNSLTQRNSSARGVKFNLEPSAQMPQTYLVGSNSNNSLHQMSSGYQEASSKFQKNVSVMQSSAYDKPLPGFSASNGYLTQVHSPSKHATKSGNGKITPEMHPINLGAKQMISSKHPQKKQASIYSNSHVNTSILSNSQHIADISQTTLNQNSMLVDEHQTALDYQFHSRPSSLDKKVTLQQNPALQQQLRKQIEVNNYLRGQLVSDSPQKLDSMVQIHVAQQKALLPGVQIKNKAQEEMLLQRPKQLNEIKRGDVTPPQSSGTKASTHYQNSLIQSQFGGSKQTRTNLGAKSGSGNLNTSVNVTSNSTTQRSARGENLNVSQDAIKMAVNEGKQPKTSLLLANSQKKMKQESVSSQKLPQKFIINPSAQPMAGKQAQIQNIILQQTKRQKSKTNVNSLQNSIVHQGSSQVSLKSAAVDALMQNVNTQRKDLVQYIDALQKPLKDASYEVQKRHSVKTTQNSPRMLNLNQAAINRNYYKQQISAPGSDKYHSSSNLLNGSYSELHNLPNDLNRSSKRSLQADDRSKPQNQASSRKIQQQAKAQQPYVPVPRKDYFSMAPQQVASLQASGSKTPSRLIDNHLVYQYQDLSTIQVEHSDQVIRDKRLSLNADRKMSGQQSPNLHDQYLALLQRNNSRLSSNDESSTDQQNRRHLNPILDGGTGTSNNLMPQNDSQTDFHRQPRAKGKGQLTVQQLAQAGKQSKTPNLKQEHMIYLGQPGTHLQNAESLKILSKQPTTKKKTQSPGLAGKKQDQLAQKHASLEKAQLKIIPTKETFSNVQYRPIDQRQDKTKSKLPKQIERSVEAPDQRQQLQMLFDSQVQGLLDKRSNSQPSVDNQQLKFKQNIAEPAISKKLISQFEQQHPTPVALQKVYKLEERKLSMEQRQNSGLNQFRVMSNIVESDMSQSVRQSQIIEDKISNSQYVASGNQYYHPPSGSSTAKSQTGIKTTGSNFKKQGSHPSMKKQPSQNSLVQSRPSSAVRRPQPSDGHDKTANQRMELASDPSGPRKQSRADKPLQAKEPFITSLEKFAREMEEECQRLVTEEDAQEIRDVASDINERAFYGKILKTKKALESGIKDLKQLSPRSQEIGSVMQLVHDSFKNKGQPPITQITFYRIGKMLGRGAFGKVNLAMHKLVRKLVALKSLNKQVLTDEAHKAKLMKEVNLLLKLRHNHVVKIYETIETDKHIIIVMELCAGGDLLNYVRKRRRLKEPYAQKIFKQIIDGLCYIHAKQIAHRDIKLDNILLDGKGNVKIGDFGVSRQISEGQIMREQCGTPAYIAPEILRNKGYGLNVDIWSAGVVLFAMLYGTVPFKAQSMEELHQLILKGKYLLKEDVSEEARDMLRGLLEINPKKRLTIKQIYQHPWLKSMDKSIQLFTDEEREMIRKEYTYNDPSRYNRNENEEPVDCFTEHGFESEYSTFKNQTSKSVILAPFNSTMSEDEESQSFNDRLIQSLMQDKPAVLRFAKKCREIDRQYEFNNNGKLDNGVYHKQIANNSFEGDQNMSGTQGIEIVQYLSENPSIQYNVKGKEKSKPEKKEGLSATEEAQQTFETFQKEASQRGLDAHKIDKLVAFGYPETYVRTQLEQMQPNYCTAGYYLLEMDQNYC